MCDHWPVLELTRVHPPQSLSISVSQVWGDPVVVAEGQLQSAAALASKDTCLSETPLL